MENKKITFTFTVEQANTIITALSKEPYIEVFQLMEYLKVDGERQMQVPTIDNQETTLLH